MTRTGHMGSEEAVEMFAESDHASIFRCPHGCLHFQIGAVCMTVTPQELAEVSAVVLCAIERVQRGLRRDASPHN